MAPRTPRDEVSREKTARDVFVPASQLPEPTPIDGYGHRWIATHVLNELQSMNVSAKMREGWEPVRADDDPKLAMFANKNGNIEIGGLMLCKMPTETIQARDRYYANAARAQMESVDNNFMATNDPRMPVFSDKKSTTSRGGGFGNGTK